MITRYKPKEDKPISPNGISKLPLDRQIAVYYRQSTDAQIGNISTTIQTVDMVKHLKGRGWSDENIVMIDMDAGISGSTKIDDRPGMKKLYELISQEKIGAVACQDEDRLFRDVTQIQVNIFIEACRVANVFVLTPTMVYDFANEMMGAFHARQFRFKSEMAAEYINTVIRGKLHRAKTHMLMEGRWAGAGLPPGFMIDYRKTLADGSKNPDWRRFKPFEPYAEVVREYFKMFLAQAGNVRATFLKIQAEGPYYPDPKSTLPPEGYKIVYRMHRHGGGFCPSRRGLVELLTNAAYIGHWSVNDVIEIWSNHEAIVTKDLFMRAFNYLSRTTLAGLPNPNYAPFQEHARPSLENKRSVERPLCAGMMISKHQGDWKKVGVKWKNLSNNYAYVLWGPAPKEEYIWGKKAEYVDEAVLSLLEKKLRATFDEAVWEKTIASFSDEYEKARKMIESQIKSLEKVMENLIGSLESLTNPDMVRAAQRKYEATQNRHERLSNELAMANSEVEQLQKLKSLKETYGLSLDRLARLSRNEKRIIMHAFINQIEATPVINHGLLLVVRWKDNSDSEFTLPRKTNRGTNWLEDDLRRLFILIENKASQVEIAREFPNRKWESIRDKVWRMRGSGSLVVNPKPIKDNETFWDYLKREDISLDSIGSMNSPSVGHLTLNQAMEVRILPS